MTTLASPAFSLRRRIIAYWMTTALVIFELVLGGAWLRADFWGWGHYASTEGRAALLMNCSTSDPELKKGFGESLFT